MPFLDNMEKYCRAGWAADDTIIRYMRIACCIIKGTNTRSEYEILIAFARQPWLRERSSMLRYMCIATVVDKRTVQRYLERQGTDRSRCDYGLR